MLKLSRSTAILSRNTLAKYESCQAKKGSVLKISLIIAVLYESCDGTQVLQVLQMSRNTSDMEHSYGPAYLTEDSLHGTQLLLTKNIAANENSCP